MYISIQVFFKCTFENNKQICVSFVDVFTFEVAVFLYM
jgi:hypothetical protein